MKEGAFLTWEDIMTMLEDGYTLSTADICEELKASRTFVAKCVLPHLGNSLYLDSGVRGGVRVNSSLLKLVNRTFGLNLTGSKLYCRRVFDQLIYSNLKAEQRTKSVPISYFMDVSACDKYTSEYRYLSEEFSHKLMDGSLKTGEFMLHIHKMKTLWMKYVSDDVTDVVANLSIIEALGRSVVEYVNVAVPDSVDFVTEREYRGYGGTDEGTHRKFFTEGYLRLTLTLPGIDGTICSKVYYMPDPEYIPSTFEGESRFVFDLPTYYTEIMPRRAKN